MKMKVRLITIVSSPSEMSPLRLTPLSCPYGFSIMRMVSAMPRPTSSENMGATPQSRSPRLQA